MLYFFYIIFINIYDWQVKRLTKQYLSLKNEQKLLKFEVESVETSNIGTSSGNQSKKIRIILDSKNKGRSGMGVCY